MSPNLTTKSVIETITFDHQPTFAERWAIMVGQIYPHHQRYVDDFEALLLSYGLTRESRLLDICAGEGMPAIDLIQRGWQVDTLDASADMVEVYNRCAARHGLTSRCILGNWMEVANYFRPGSYELVICHGNTFIHAPGGWNRDETSFPHAEKAYHDTLCAFRSMLAPHGYLYLDKSRDHDDPGTDEHRELIAELNVCGRIEKLFFLVEYLPGQIRRTSFLRVLDDGIEIRLSNTAPLLPTSKLERLLRGAGFNTMTPATVASETPYFQGWMIR
jgi:SAM-dependent methyltransferase